MGGRSRLRVLRRTQMQPIGPGRSQRVVVVEVGVDDVCQPCLRVSPMDGLGGVPGRLAALPQKTGGVVPVLAMRRDFRLVAMPRVRRVAMPRVEMSIGLLFAPGWPRDEAFSMAGRPVRMRWPRSS